MVILPRGRAASYVSQGPTRQRPGERGAAISVVF